MASSVAAEVLVIGQARATVRVDSADTSCDKISETVRAMGVCTYTEDLHVGAGVFNSDIVP